MSPVVSEPPLAGPTPTPLPIHARPQVSEEAHARSSSPSPQKSHSALPKIRLEIRDLSHPGAKCFLDAVNATSCLEKGIASVLRLLYVSPAEPTTNCPPTRSVTLVLRDMDGVAYTTGSELDSDHKEIHFSLGYIAEIARERCAHEVEGVVTHELVHCYQWNGRGTCPGGLIEGIADWVRLRCDLSPPHWKREASGKWDGGYQHTAYFLEYLETRFGAGTVRRLNESLRTTKYAEQEYWTKAFGLPVKQLWSEYKDTFKEDGACE